MDERSQHRSRSAHVARRRSPRRGRQRIAEGFEEDGALGVLVVDASGLAPIEPQYGGDALHHALGNLGDMIQAIVADRLTVNDAVLIGEIGHEEIAVFPAARARRGGLLQARPRQDPPRRHCGPRAQRQPRGLSVHAPPAAVPRRRRHRAAQPDDPPGAADPPGARRGARAHRPRRAARVAPASRKQIIELVLERQIYSVYEPIVEVSSRTVFGYEALARGPDGTELHSPAKLFAIAAPSRTSCSSSTACAGRAGSDGARDSARAARSCS